MNENLVGAYGELSYPFWRSAGDNGRLLGTARHHVAVLLEVDGAYAGEALTRRKKQGGPEVSFTAWAVNRITQAAARHGGTA